MRHVTILGLLMLMLCVSAFGQIIDPNVGFCNVPASSACGADPNIVTSSTSFGMWSFGANDANTPWYLLVSVPEATQGTAVAPTITSADFTVALQTPDPSAYLLAPPPVVNIYDLTQSVTGLTASNSSMNNTNMFGTAEQAAFGGTPNDFAIFVYQLTPGFNGNTAYAFSSGGLTNGTFLAAIGVGGAQDNIQFSTPFTTSGLVDAPPSVPDGGMTLMLLGGALVGLETLRRRFRV